MDGRPQAGLRAAALLLPAVRAARTRTRPAAVAAAARAVPLRRAGRDGRPLLRRRPLRARGAPRLLEPEGDRRQRVPVVLPRQLAVLGPVDLRALPRDRDPRQRRRRARVLGPARSARSRRRDHARLGRALLLVLAVELRVTAGRPRRRGRVRALAEACRGGDGGGDRRARARRRPTRRVDRRVRRPRRRRGHQRRQPREPGQGRDQDRARPPAQAASGSAASRGRTPSGTRSSAWRRRRPPPTRRP